MTQRIPENYSAADWRLVNIMGNMPPRVPNDDDDDDEDEDNDTDDEDQPPVIREPEEDEQARILERELTGVDRGAARSLVALGRFPLISARPRASSGKNGHASLRGL